MRKWIVVSLILLSTLLVGCSREDKDLYKEDSNTDIINCEANEFFNGEECIIPTPAHIDYAAENSMNFRLVNDDITYYYFIVQIIPWSTGDMGTYKIEYFQKDSSTPVIEEGLYTVFNGYTLERENTEGNEYYWVLQQSGAGLYLYNVWHYEQTDEGVQSVYDTFNNMSFEFVSE